jgi:hypothetical protein
MENLEKKTYVEKTLKVDVECYAMLKQLQQIKNEENNYTESISLKSIVKQLVNEKLGK